MVEKEAPGPGESLANSLFKKKKTGFKKFKTPRGRIRERSAADSDEEGANKEPDAGSERETPSSMEAIISAKKKRKLLSSVLGKDRRGIDASLLLHPSSMQEAAQSAEPNLVAATNQDLQERLRGTFSGETGSNTVGGSADGVIQKKHQAAMEDFIRQNMATRDEKESQKVQFEETVKTFNPKDMEDQLYAELASSNMKMSGAVQEVVGERTAAQAQEGDVGAGGAMLGGTGIAEVTLPLEERMKNVRDTEAAARAREEIRNGIYQGSSRTQQQVPLTKVVEDQMLPMSFSAGMGKKSKKEATSNIRSNRPMTSYDGETVNSSANDESARSYARTASSAGADVLNRDVEGLGSSFSHNFRQHVTEYATKKKEERIAEWELVKQQEEKDAGPIANQERPGFEAARRAARGEAPEPTSGAKHAHEQRDGNRKRSNDDRVWKTFLNGVKYR